MNSIDPAISSVLAAQQQAVATQLSFAAASKSLLAQEELGQAMVDLVEAAGQTGKALDRGHLFDATA